MQIARLTPIKSDGVNRVYVLTVGTEQIARFADLRETALQSADEWLADAGVQRGGGWKFAEHTNFDAAAFHAEVA